MADLGAVGQDGNLVGPSQPAPAPFSFGGGFDGNQVGYFLRGGIVDEFAGGSDAQDATVTFGTSVSESATGTDACDATVVKLGSVSETSTGSDAQDAVVGFIASVSESATGTDAQDATVFSTSTGRSFGWIIT